jgi:cell division protease FtsH
MKEYKDIMVAIKTMLLERYVLSKDEVFALLSDLMEGEDRLQAA